MLKGGRPYYISLSLQRDPVSAATSIVAVVLVVGQRGPLYNPLFLNLLTCSPVETVASTQHCAAAVADAGGLICPDIGEVSETAWLGWLFALAYLNSLNC
jgi:hypothetical protein